MQDLCVAVGLYLSIRRYFVWQFPAMCHKDSQYGTVDRAKLLAIENKCTRIIRIAGVTFYVAPDKDTPEHRRHLIRVLESCGRRYTQKAGSYESEI